MLARPKRILEWLVNGEHLFKKRRVVLDGTLALKQEPREAGGLGLAMQVGAGGLELG